MQIRCFGLLALLICSMGRSSAQETILHTGTELSFLDTIYSKIQRLYVEENQLSKLTRTGIEATLSGLDPYSAYITAEDAKEYKTILSGRFGGTGLVIRSVNNQTTVRQIFKGYPADKAGLMVGDVLLEIDGKPLKDKTLDEVFPLLRGAPGSEVKITVRHPGKNSAEIKTLKREEVALTSVPYHGMLKGGIGYILLTSETRNCSGDVRKALLDLKSHEDLKGIVLDLRYNSGGIVSEAVKIVNLFIEKGKPIVREKARFYDTTFYAAADPVDTKTPLALLVNGATISAAEIISGSLQDHDRAVVIGSKTFGKGLVQQLYDLPTGEILKLTVAYYYTPSGRCIQSRQYSVKKEGVFIPDSLKKYFTTANGRKVSDHDGISPDLPLPEQHLPLVAKELIENEANNNLVAAFATDYCIQHPTIAPAATFTISDAEYSQFVDFLKANNFSYTTASEKKIGELKAAALQDGIWDDIQPGFLAIQDQLKKQRDKDLFRFKDQIKELLEEEIVFQRYYDWGRRENSLKNDPGVAKAAEVFAKRLNK